MHAYIESLNQLLLTSNHACLHDTYVKRILELEIPASHRLEMEAEMVGDLGELSIRLAVCILDG